jgi:hypothetical protein
MEPEEAGMPDKRLYPQLIIAGGLATPATIHD